MDEPLSDLDAQLRAELRTEITDLVKDVGATCVYVTHDQTEALTMADRVAILRRGVLQDVGAPTEVYTRPATLYVAAFLGQPRMNLVEAAVTTVFEDHVVLRLGDQELRLPWTHVRARPVARHHGERIVLGVRAEALTPVPVDTPGNVLHGRVRYLEHHGHESLAYVDVGAAVVVVDETAGPVVAASARGGIRRLFRRFGQGSTAVAERPPEPSAGRHHRQSGELTVRLAPYPPIGAGHPVTVAVDIDALHFFDGAGDRIDVGRR
jgi:multiple sugar transport system ATP-binding protein